MDDAGMWPGDALVEREEAGRVGGRRAASDAAAVAAKTRSAQVEKDGNRAGGMQRPVGRDGCVERAVRTFTRPSPTMSDALRHDIGTPSRKCRTLRTCLTRPSEPWSPPPPPPQSLLAAAHADHSVGLLQPQKKCSERQLCSTIGIRCAPRAGALEKRCPAWRPTDHRLHRRPWLPLALTAIPDKGGAIILDQNAAPTRATAYATRYVVAAASPRIGRSPVGQPRVLQPLSPGWRLSQRSLPPHAALPLARTSPEIQTHPQTVLLQRWRACRRSQPTLLWQPLGTSASRTIGCRANAAPSPSVHTKPPPRTDDWRLDTLHRPQRGQAVRRPWSHHTGHVGVTIGFLQGSTQEERISLAPTRAQANGD